MLKLFISTELATFDLLVWNIAEDNEEKEDNTE